MSPTQESAGSGSPGIGNRTDNSNSPVMPSPSRSHSNSQSHSHSDLHPYAHYDAVPGSAREVVDVEGESEVEGEGEGEGKEDDEDGSYPGSRSQSQSSSTMNMPLPDFIFDDSNPPIELADSQLHTPESNTHRERRPARGSPYPNLNFDQDLHPARQDSSDSALDPSNNQHHYHPRRPTHTTVHQHSRYSSTSEGYPSWLPRRPPPPAPASTVQSTSRMPSPFGIPAGTGTGTPSQLDADADDEVDVIAGLEGIGRKATPRSVRIISVASSRAQKERDRDAAARRHRYQHQHSHALAHYSERDRLGTDQSRASYYNPRVYSRGTAALSPTVFSTTSNYFRNSGRPGGKSGAAIIPPSGASRPRFRAISLRTHLLDSPSVWKRVWFFFYPLFVFGHLVLQTFFDFNAIFVLVQVAKFPTPAAPGVPGNGRGWALAVAAYVACWFVQVFGVFVLYELVYSFYRRWRLKRPLMVPLYLSSPAFNLVCLTSYTNFCFMHHIRTSARPHLPIPRFFSVFGISSSRSSFSVTQQSPGPSARPSQDEQHVAAARFAAAVEAENLHMRTHSQSTEGTQRSQLPVPLGLNNNDSSSPVIVPRVEDRPLSSWSDYFAETCYFYSQNLPTVSVLVPRAALCLSALLVFGSAQVQGVVLANSGMQRRDSTFFDEDGALSGYAKGVLIANAAWTAWRILVLLASWLGLWIVSGQSLGGLCGPRYRWEEEDTEKRLSVLSTGTGDEAAWYRDDGVGLAWEWKECTRQRVQDAFEFCLADKPPARWSVFGGLGGSGLNEKGMRVGSVPGTDERRRHTIQMPLPVSPLGFAREKKKREVSVDVDVEDEPVRAVQDSLGLDDEGLQRVLAAVGFPSSPLPARRGALSQELFEDPGLEGTGGGEKEKEKEMVGDPKAFGEIIPPVREMVSGGQSPPLKSLPYPFAGYPAAQVSSEDQREVVDNDEEEEEDEEEDEDEEEGHEEGEEDEEEDEDAEPEGGGEGAQEDEDEADEDEERDIIVDESAEMDIGVEEPTSGSEPASNSLSSLGHPMSSRYPFQFRRPRRSRGGRSSLGTNNSKSASSSHQTESTQSRHSRVSQSTGNLESEDSRFSQALSGPTSPVSLGSGDVGSSPIPMPPRRGQRGSSLGSLLPAVQQHGHVMFPRDRTRTESASTAASRAFDPETLYESEGEEEEEGHEHGDEHEEEGSQEAAEREDSVGLLSSAPSRRSSLGALRSARGSNLSLGLGVGRPRHNSDGHSHSTSSASRSRSASAVRSRAQSLIQSLGAASRSSLSFDAGRSRTNSMARLEESEHDLEVERSGSVLASGAGAGSRSASGSGSHSASASVSLSQRGRSSGEDHTFGMPLRTQAPAVYPTEDHRRPRVISGISAQRPSVLSSQEHVSPLAQVTQPVEAPSVSEQTVSEHSYHTVPSPSGSPPDHATHPQPQQSQSQPQQLVPPEQALAHSQSMISSAPDSFITPAATMEGTSDSGRTPSSWGTVHVPHHSAEPSGSTWGQL